MPPLSSATAKQPRQPRNLQDANQALDENQHDHDPLQSRRMRVLAVVSEHVELVLQKAKALISQRGAVADLQVGA